MEVIALIRLAMAFRLLHAIGLDGDYVQVVFPIQYLGSGSLERILVQTW